ncbi:hypothetical protein SD457_21080 [Coprobacillaceae bacterium CR2/5/TPMF4]|nr:hypothetical protein SD457_21080 [Coprobacillaceae bacterium CR2/5/TPMF4]
MGLLTGLMTIGTNMSNIFAYTGSEKTNLPSIALVLLIPFMLGVIYLAFKGETK